MRDLHNVGKYAARRKRNRIWRSIVTGIAGVVVFCTTYALILPAITLETQEYICGQEAHTHGPECYQLTCGLEEIFSHTHSDECYDGQTLICTLEERTVHHHTASCYSQPTPICGQEAAEAHTHTPACSGIQPVLVCGQEEAQAHAHSDSCYTDGVLTCALAETPGHTHSDSCYQEQSVLLCGKAETQGHTHTEECYPADFEPELICGQEDIPEHRHSEECYTRICELEEHTHSELCVDSHEAYVENLNQIVAGEGGIDWTDPAAAEEEGYVLICENEDEGHVHTEDCYAFASQGTSNFAIFSTARSVEASGIMPLAEGDTGGLPVGDISAVNTKYDSKTDSFATSVTITFTFPGKEDQPAVSPGTAYIYTYPEGVIIPDDLLNKEQTLLDKSSHPAGTYKFIKNDNGTYSVQAVFSQDYVSKNVGTGTDYPVEGYINYGYEFSGSQLKDGKLQFGDNGYLLPISGKIAYPDDSTESYNIDVSKEGSWVQDGDKLVYTVYVRTAKGTPNPITFSDNMTIPEGLTLGEPTVSIEKGTAITYYQIWDNSWGYTDQNDWVTVTDVSPNYNAGVLNMSLPSLTAQPDSNNSSNIISQVYKVTYTYPISDQTQASVSPNNSVNVSATDSDKGQIVKDSAEKTVTVSKDFSYTVDKSGAIASDKPGYIQWTVTVNSNKQNLVGAKLTDEMLGVADDAGGVTIEPSTGAQVNRDGSSKITDITFTEYENGVNKNQYTITYYTPVTETWDGTTVNNKATLDPDPDTPDDEKNATASVTVSGVQLNKTGSHNAVTDKLDWVITVNAGKLDIAGATLTDDMFSALTGTDFTVTSSDGTNSGYQFVYGENGTTINGITFPAQSDGKNTQTYTIRYTTDIPTNSNGTTATSVTNTATLFPGEGKTGTPIPATSTVTLEEASLSKGGSYDWWYGGINWTVTVNENKKNIAAAVFTDSMLGQLTSGDIAIKNENGQAADSGQYTIQTDANGKVTGIVFNPIGDTGANTNQYTITYFTSAPQEWSDRLVHNEAKLTLDGKEIPAPADVTVPGSGDIAKSAGGGTVSEDGSTITIPWTVTLTVPKGGLPISTIIIDDVTKKDEWTTNTNQWITTEQADALKAAGMTWTDDDGNEKEIVALSDGQVAWTGDVDHYTGFEITFQDGLTPPEGATKLTFTYNTTADLAQTTIGQNVFYNFVSVGEKTKGAEYSYYKPGVVKTDGNNSASPSTVTSEGELTWKIKATVGEGNSSFTLLDTLPDGVTLQSLRFTDWTGKNNMDLPLTIGENGAISGADANYTVIGSIQSRNVTLTVSPNGGGTFQAGEVFTLVVTCQVNDAANVTGSAEFTNSAKMTLDGQELAPVSQTQSWTYQEDAQDVVSKNGKWDNNARLLTYTLAINPEGKDLDPELDYLELKDVLKYNSKLWATLTGPQWSSEEVDVNISLNQGSVTLKNAETGGAATDWSWTYSTAAESDWSQYILNTLTVTIPDGTPLRLEYSYSVSSNAKEGYTFELDVSNKATLQSLYSDEDRLESGRKWSNQTTSGGVTSSSSLLTLTKVNAANNGEYLPGAEFSVYAYRQSMVDGVTTASWEYERKYTTDDKGAITISQGDASKGEYVFDTDVLFKVVETKAPSGYLLPDSPPEYYFYFSGSGSSSMALPDGVALTSATDLNTIGNSYLVKNTKIPTTSVTVNKEWRDKDGNVFVPSSGSISFDLYQLASTTPPTQGSTGGSGESGSGTANLRFTVSGSIADSAGYLSSTYTKPVGTTVVLTIEDHYGDKGNPTVTWNRNSLTPSITQGDPFEATWGVSYTPTCYTYSFTLAEGDNTVNITSSGADCLLTQFRITEPSASTESDPLPTGGTKYREEPYILSPDNGWGMTIPDLPVTGLDGSGNVVYYTYYVVETTTGYDTSYENNDGIVSGTILIKNKRTESPAYELPATGGMGTEPYTLGGLLMVLLAAIPLIYRSTRRRKGGSG